VVNGILWVLAIGAPWRDAPTCFGPWQTVYARFARWSDDGTWHRILCSLRTAAERAGRIDWSLVCVDGTSVRVLMAAEAVAAGRVPG
jgi:transposase